MGRCSRSGWASDSPWPSAVFAKLPRMDFPSSLRAESCHLLIGLQHQAKQGNSEGSDGGGLNAKDAAETDGGVGGTRGRGDGRDTGCGGVV